MEENMKMKLIILGAAALVLTGCAPTQVSVAPVGPNPGDVAAAAGNGQLEVFSAFSARLAGNDPTWRQHSDYYILDSHGRRLEHVANAAGFYSTLPRSVSLPAGQYIVKARAKGTLWMRVPVLIKPDEITRVHLDGDWQPNVPGVQVVMGPAGYPVGWKAQ
jgi:hypothetical protein